MERASWVFHQEALIKKGGDLLSHFRSTIGAEGLNFSVRNGKRWNTLAITTCIFRCLFTYLVPRQISISAFFFSFNDSKEKKFQTTLVNMFCSFFKKKEAFG